MPQFFPQHSALKTLRVMLAPFLVIAVIAVLGLLFSIRLGASFHVMQGAFSIVDIVLVILVSFCLAAYVVIVIRAHTIHSLEEIEKERSALLNLAMHQLGMPLATFRWWLEILRERDHGKFCRRGDICDQLEQGITRMDTIIRALQSAYDLQTDILKYHPERTPIESAVRLVANELSQSYGAKKQTLIVDVPKNVMPLKIDKRLFAGLLRELLENACFYSPEKTSVAVHARAVRGGVQISIQDHGYGIPKKDLPSIFQKFTRGSNASKYKPAGNGLGLYIVRTIVDRAHGKIKIFSTLNKGTTVKIFLPAS